VRLARMMLSTLAFALVAAASAACGGTSVGGGADGESVGSGSCASSAGGTVVTCTDFGAGFSSSMVMQECSAMMTTYSASSCPTANRVGHCDISITRNGQTAADAVSFYPPETASAGQQACNMENGFDGATTTFVAN
jgi:hypothetical protein